MAYLRLWTDDERRICSRHLAAGGPVTQNRLKVLPSLSNVGEPDTFLPLSDRPAQMAVFGAAGVSKEYIASQYRNSPQR